MNLRDSTGSCTLCGVELPAKKMTSHLASCIEDYRYEVGRDEQRGDRGYQLAFHVKRAPVFWVQLLVRPDATLAHLDAFFRDIWMEDRSKQSRFVIGRSVYSSNRSTNVTPSNLQGDLSPTMQEVLEADVPFEYAYDLEQTTELEGRVVNRRSILPDQRDNPIRLLARNRLPNIPCSCGEPAEWMCPSCAEDSTGWLCAACADDHECAGELTDIRNSPRTIIQE